MLVEMLVEVSFEGFSEPMGKAGKLNEKLWNEYYKKSKKNVLEQVPYYIAASKSTIIN